MSKDGKIMLCITGNNMREVVNKANELDIPREDIITLTTIGKVIYLVYYK